MTADELLKRIDAIASELKAEIVRLDREHSEQLEELKERLAEKEDV